MYKDFKAHLEKEIINTKNSGLYKRERVIVSPQSSEINTKDQKIAYIIPNQNIDLGESLEQFQVPISTLEKSSGLHFQFK